MATPSEAKAWQQAGEIMSAAQAFKDNIAAKHGVKNKEQNALGQKEEGMTRYQMKKEAKRLMYLQSTEAAPEMRKITKKNSSQRYFPGGMAFPGGEKTKKAFWGLSVRLHAPVSPCEVAYSLLWRAYPKILPAASSEGRRWWVQASTLTDTNAEKPKAETKDPHQARGARARGGCSQGGSGGGGQEEEEAEAEVLVFFVLLFVFIFVLKQ